MGCFNYTCFLTGHAVGWRDEVAILLVNESYGALGVRAYFEPAPFFIYGTYNDYGGAENCHGTQLNLLKKVIMNHAVSLEPSEGHQETVGVNKNEVGMKRLFRGSDQGELRFYTPATFKAALKGEADPHTPVKHLMILQSALDKLLERYTYTVSDYDVDEEGIKSYIGPVEISYQDVIDGIPTYIEELRKFYNSEDRFFTDIGPNVDDLPKEARPIGMFLRMEMAEASFFWHQPVRDAIRNSFLADREDHNDFTQLTEFLTEFAKRAIVDDFLYHARRSYIPINHGSQHRDWDSLLLIGDITKEIAEERQAEYDAEELPEDMYDPVRDVYMEQEEFDLAVPNA